MPTPATASPPTIDFDQLLAPISPDQPTGINLKVDAAPDNLYHKIKHDADTSRTSERQMRTAERNADGSVKDKIEPTVWPKVISQATTVLTSKSKDLWVASWLIEGLVREEGFSGLRDGFRLVRELSEKYWENLYPPLEEDDVADGEYTSVIQLSRLVGGETDGTLTAPVLQIPIVSSSQGGEYTGADYLQAEDIEKMSDPTARQNRIDNGAVTFAQFEQAATDTPAGFYTKLLAEVKECLDEYLKMSEVLAAKCVDADGNVLAPSVSQTERLLNDCLDRIKFAAKHVLGEEAVGGAAEGNKAGDGGGGGVGGGAAGAPAAGAPAAAGNVQSRETAFRELLKIADFFARTEPHSPVSYAIKQVVGWGKMALPELIADLIDEQAVRESLFRRTGIPPPPPKTD